MIYHGLWLLTVGWFIFADLELSCEDLMSIFVLEAVAIGCFLVFGAIILHCLQTKHRADGFEGESLSLMNSGSRRSGTESQKIAEGP